MILALKYSEEYKESRFKDFTLYRLINTYHRFESIVTFNFMFMQVLFDQPTERLTLKPNVLVTTYQPTRCDNPEDQNPHQHQCENLTSQSRITSTF